MTSSNLQSIYVCFSQQTAFVYLQEKKPEWSEIRVLGVWVQHRWLVEESLPYSHNSEHLVSNGLRRSRFGFLAKCYSIFRLDLWLITQQANVVGICDALGCLVFFSSHFTFIRIRYNFKLPLCFLVLMDLKTWKMWSLLFHMEALSAFCWFRERKKIPWCLNGSPQIYLWIEKTPYLNFRQDLFHYILFLDKPEGPG